MSDIIELPEMTRGLECRLRDAYDNASAVALEHPDLIDAMEAVVEAYLSEVVRWQPIEHDQVRAGMRIRATVAWGDRVTSHTGVAHRASEYGGWLTEDARRLTGWNGLVTYEVDPATIPADPDQGILDLLALWYQQGPKGAVSLLTELRTIADVTPKAVAGDE